MPVQKCRIFIQLLISVQLELIFGVKVGLNDDQFEISRSLWTYDSLKSIILNNKTSRLLAHHQGHGNWPYSWFATCFNYTFRSLTRPFLIELRVNSKVVSTIMLLPVFLRNWLASLFNSGSLNDWKKFAPIFGRMSRPRLCKSTVQLFSKTRVPRMLSLFCPNRSY